MNDLKEIYSIRTVFVSLITGIFLYCNQIAGRDGEDRIELRELNFFLYGHSSGNGRFNRESDLEGSAYRLPTYPVDDFR